MTDIETKREEDWERETHYHVWGGAGLPYLTSDSDAVAVANIRISDVDLRTEGNNPFLRLGLEWVREGKEVVRR
jgi:hypothetical protein